jgi:raffinose/stachyose/melibiose transport system substrate-binding protein
MFAKVKKIIPWLVVLTLLLVSLAACQPADEPAQAPEAEAEEPMEEPEAEEPPPPAEMARITYYAGLGEDEEDCNNTYILEPFEEANPNIDVEWIKSPPNWDQVLKTELAGGAGPDLITELGPTTMVDFAKAGYLLPMDAVAEEYGWADRFAPWALNLGRVDGELYMLPTEIETLVLYYNKTLFEANGWEPPTTMDELFVLAEQIDEAGVIPFAHGGKSEWRGVNEWYVGEFFNHIAGPEAVYQALAGEKPWTDPEFVEAVQLLDDMMQAGWFVGGLDRYMTATFSDSRTMFGFGDAAMNIEGTWLIGGLEGYFGEEAGNENDWDWVPVPSKSGNAIFDIGVGSTFGINVNSPHPEEAALFLDHIFSPETQALFFNNCGRVPGPVPVKESLLTDVDPRNTEILALMNQSSQTGDYGYTTWTFFPPATQEHIIAEIKKVWTGDLSVEEFLAQMQEIFAGEFADGLVPPLPAR